ncbi:amino acid ABC transporter substrate-binding protein [Paraburkholderia sp. SOS3]|jgi:general L-amino acid transport system substrate-binding protein|uniref:amino acid ABC transporter substrate-binding protein n=1 Tax=Paraburkholderia sp. SOS3 TaxID=1926494 RepID=UPI00094741D9|nr:amino acid ABC transporter substrate-binding protein [Paraburkholderia sp. SOS3]APR38490.1 ABC transporter substrate-binding protein [Paraburkholderia sp. SOS3]
MTEKAELLGVALLVVLLAFTGLAPAAQPTDGKTLISVRARGVLRCGVSEGIEGFSSRNAAGQWTGIDVDFCRALAAAALGDARKVQFVSLRTAARFPALVTGDIDVLSRNTSWTLLREAALKVQFAGVIFYDSQAFIVPANSGLRSATSLKGATVCVQKDTSTMNHLVVYSTALDLRMTPLVMESADDASDAFLSGRCTAYTADASYLDALRLHAPGGAAAFTILPERISKEPLGPAVRGNDDAWLTLVRWVLLTLIAAEELDVTRENLQTRLRDPTVEQALVPDDTVTRAIGVEPGWTLRALQSAGNYGELFDRNVGANSPLGLERGMNGLWTRGGLMYAPPLR